MKTQEIEFNPVFTHFLDDQYHWKLILNGQSFEYRQGSAYFTPYFKPHNGGLLGRRNKKPKNGTPNKQLNGWLHLPTLDDALYCLLSDMDCGDYSFQEFCDNLGYDSDSMSAFDTYRACQENGNKLRKALTRDQIEEYRIKLEDY